MKVLVTGGAGYIGSVLVTKLIESGYEVNVLDDLSTGHLESINKNAHFFQGSILDMSDLEKSMYGCDAVCHFAAKTLVAESVSKPELYMKVNLEGTENVLKTMVNLKINKLIMASTCAVYKASDKPLNENSEIGPTNPYGNSKLKADLLISDYSSKHGISSISFRFFNAAGSYYSNSMGWLTEMHNPETHLIPNLINSSQENIFKLYGTDWETPDGTCIRDYVHVLDISNACLTAISIVNQSSHEIINLGSSIGVSVQEVINTYIEIGASNLFMENLDRRQGDSKILIADPTKAKKFLNWAPKFSLKDIVETMIRAKKDANEN
jgi:UDP-glucose 4-epimerase